MRVDLRSEADARTTHDFWDFQAYLHYCQVVASRQLTFIAAKLELEEEAADD
jgi:hypothetical protein